MTGKWQLGMKGNNICRIVCPKPTQENWELKRKWRNLATKERRCAIKAYWA